MGFKFIQQIQQRESRSQNLTKLPADFFSSLAVHLEQLSALARDEMARDPMSTTATLLQNELRNTLSLAQDIVLLRLRKMANRAVDSLEGGKVDVRALTPTEKDLYGEMASFMARSRQELLPRTGPAAASRAVARDAGEAHDPGGTGVPMTGPEVEGGAKAAEPVAAPAAAPNVPGTSDAAAVDAAFVHVTRDTPPFAGEDGQTYSLKKGDMVSLPKKLAQVLVDRGMAEEVDGSL